MVGVEPGGNPPGTQSADPQRKILATTSAAGRSSGSAASMARPVVRGAGFRVDFGYGRTDVSRFPRAAWLRSVHTVLTTTPNDRFAYLDRRGMPELHEALCDYLNDLDEAEVVTAAARHGLGIHGVDPYRITGTGPGGLIFGYAILSATPPSPRGSR